MAYLRSAASSTASFLDANWQALNLQAQQAVFQVAEEEGLTAEADMRIQGRVQVSVPPPLRQRRRYARARRCASAAATPAAADEKLLNAAGDSTRR